MDHRIGTNHLIKMGILGMINYITSLSYMIIFISIIFPLGKQHVCTSRMRKRFSRGCVACECRHSVGVFSAHASVPEVNINVYKISYLRAPRFLLMNKFITQGSV